MLERAEIRRPDTRTPGKVVRVLRLYARVDRQASGEQAGMSFWISVYDVDPTSGQSKGIEPPSRAAGFNSWGHEVYGSALALALGPGRGRLSIS